MTYLPSWQHLSRAELDAAYDNRAAVPDSAARLARLTEDSARHRTRPGALLDRRYGPAPRNVLDYFPGGRAGAPVLVFIHGGYWQANHKDMFACMAQGPGSIGLDVAVVGYSLAPQARLADIVAEIGQAVTWLSTEAAGPGAAGRPIVLSGWSAGAHLAVMNAHLPSVAMALLISGVYDLEPCRRGRINDKLGLGSPEEARALSPLHQLDAGWPPLVLAYGTGELPALQQQTQGFYQAGKARGCDMTLDPIEGANHFTVLDELSRPGGRLLAHLSSWAACPDPGHQRRHGD